mmetsp:Transcript_50311/g.106932  ORF Transcript_50311/g.106932 Transcript_50311/m.106932 type:complete len:211 (-) Transcript_50311:389-1021(-)
MAWGRWACSWGSCLRDCCCCCRPVAAVLLPVSPQTLMGRRGWSFVEVERKGIAVVIVALIWGPWTIHGPSLDGASRKSRWVHLTSRRCDFCFSHLQRRHGRGRQHVATCDRGIGWSSVGAPGAVLGARGTNIVCVEALLLVAPIGIALVSLGPTYECQPLDRGLRTMPSKMMRRRSAGGAGRGRGGGRVLNDPHRPSGRLSVVFVGVLSI